ncbi:polyprenyl synthetase family protein [Candidatus Phycorickettsia trachydisci]|nr:polyprenyl synthetase family protein [Candidatus Phycorickettsia trachydisci]
MQELKQPSSIEKTQNFLADDIKALENLMLSCFAGVSEDLIQDIASHLLIKGKGKMIRPLLCMLTSKMLGYKGDAHIKLSASIELIHLATLLHDDVIDESDMRRSLPTANVIWGNKASILSGDFFFSKAFKLMVSAGSLASLDVLADTASKMVEGEVKQMLNLQNKTFISQEDYFQVIEYKTAKLFSAACKVAALISQEEYVDTLAEFGHLYGVIYQIQDDTADYFSNSTGKLRGKDFLEGKITLPLIMLQNKVNQTEREVIEKIFENERSQQDLDKVLSLMKKYEILNALEIKVGKLANQAKNLLNNIARSTQAKNLLTDLVNWLAHH